MKPTKNNIFKNIPAIIPEELFENLLVRENLKIERIISHGHNTTAGEWYDQAWDEWVILLQGEAILGYEDGNQVNLTAGDYVLISAHNRHRVEWTQPDANTIWLAIHFVPSE
ncbi:MAG: cupin domain-containing protein [Methyloglobulus sp.]